MCFEGSYVLISKFNDLIYIINEFSNNVDYKQLVSELFIKCITYTFEKSINAQVMPELYNWTEVMLTRSLFVMQYTVAKLESCRPLKLFKLER